ncbi:uncharacterized protein BDR25DRAFT_252342 [Lindgomyces ingoldianus]|uniref:Uncharacterized protein n=1 Tax=Lindgomyces ingoldianus TaxID=673940 RepID=A0ACB6RAX5_9PLEO|nr:uncharacterized protein BDR25DRAFT_252342 [Lindgomyces ingoldianus]KAF2476394.1 hypothetical protein BDR25DRAFT_252342 [Lindgomyces ingoldianus]
MHNVLSRKIKGLEELQRCLPDQPYSIILRLKLAKAFKALGYPDLAVGDAYKALLLIDEVLGEGEYYEEALRTAKSDLESIQANTAQDAFEVEDQNAVDWAKTSCSECAYEILVSCLIDCGCLRSAFKYNSRALREFPNTDHFKSYREILAFKVKSYFEANGETLDVADIEEYPDKGLVRRELYPWNHHEPNRFSPETIRLLNEEMKSAGPKLEVKVTTLPLLASWNPTSSQVKQLGIFAKEEVSPGELILREKSLLTAVARLHEFYCDACSKKLDEDAVTLTCDDCNEVFFCSEECLELAQSQYHPVLCGVSFEKKARPSEAPDVLYSLLLIRAMALAEVQGAHPLDLKEVRYIWGDYHGLNLDRISCVDSEEYPKDPFRSVPQTLPFSFNLNVLNPLNILLKMDVNIFEQSHRYDTWIFNTLYAKFRGTASAEQGRDGRPEIGAVHPLWSLANHSCNPNVTWEWQGSIKFLVRDSLVEWKGGEPKHQSGLLAGEEVLSHYCDVTLPVKERREWAAGALGGECVCARCLWEEAEENKDKDDTAKLQPRA